MEIGLPQDVLAVGRDVRDVSALDSELTLATGRATLQRGRRGQGLPTP